MTLQTTLGRFVVATTENPRKSFCIFDRWEKRDVKDERGLIRSFKTLTEARKAISALHDMQDH